jgi:hypothetical protein
MASLELRQEDAIIAMATVAKTRTRDFSFADGKRILEVMQYLSSPPPEEGETPKFKFHYDANEPEEGAAGAGLPFDGLPQGGGAVPPPAAKPEPSTSGLRLPTPKFVGSTSGNVNRPFGDGE